MHDAKNRFGAGTQGFSAFQPNLDASATIGFAAALIFTQLLFIKIAFYRSFIILRREALLQCLFAGSVQVAKTGCFVYNLIGRCYQGNF
jgi:hypothetical protein